MPAYKNFSTRTLAVFHALILLVWYGRRINASAESVKFNIRDLKEIKADLIKSIKPELKNFSVNPESSVDVVITWVNSSEPQFHQEYEKAMSSIDKTKYKDLCNKNSAIWKARYKRSSVNIFLNILSLCSQQSWVRKIYVVSNHEFDTSYFLPSCSNRIDFVKHDEIIPKKYLPVYNSKIIEAFIYQIPKLSGIYVYVNDDIIFTHSFDLRKLVHESLQILIPSDRHESICNFQYDHPDINFTMPHHHHVYINNFFMFAEKFETKKCIPWSSRGHKPYFQLKSLNNLTWSIFKSNMLKLCSNKFRYEKHYKLGGDFNSLVLSNYVGEYLGVTKFNDQIFQSMYPTNKDDVVKAWADPQYHSIIMHLPEDYTKDSNYREKVCKTIVTKSCNQVKALRKENQVKTSVDCINKALKICELDIDKK